MKKYLVLLVLVATCGLWGKIEVEYHGDEISIRGSFEIVEQSEIDIAGTSHTRIKIADCYLGGNPGNWETSYYSKLLSLPEHGNWEVRNFDYQMRELKLDKALSYSEGAEDVQKPEGNIWVPEQLISISEPVIMRQIRMSQLTINASVYNPATQTIKILTDINLVLSINESNRANTKAGRGALSGSSFAAIAEDNVCGYEPARSSEPGSYLIICPDDAQVVSSLTYLKEWKQQLGHHTEIVTLSETGDTNDEIKSYLQNAYNSWETKPEYVILVGDVNGALTMPAWYIDGYLEPYCVTDHPYTLLEGEDYFPDIQIGRFSVQSLSQLQTIISKVINYERNPVESSDWTTRALMLSFVMDYGGNYAMYSQRETVMAIRDKLLDFTYTEVDTFIAPWQTGPSNLTNYINTGYSFINYRGAGSPVYWSGGYDHMYTLWDIETQSNGFMLPMVTSIVCGGGNFAYGNYDTSFGEQWLAAGSTTNPRGAIGFIGPSEHDTKTPFNNCNDMGIYQGITQEEIYQCAPMMLRGKMELYRNYPGCHSMDGINDAWDSDMFYFYVYNLLGDPGLAIWTDTPQHYELELPESLPAGTTTLEIELATALGESHNVCVTKDGTIYSQSQTDVNGWAAVSVPDTLGCFTVTVSHYGYVPYSQEITITETEQLITLSSIETTSALNCGSSIDVEVELTNLTGVAQENVNVQLIEDDEQISITNAEQIIAEMASGATAELSFTLTAADEWRTENSIWVHLLLNEGALGSHAIEIELNSPQIEYAGRTVQNTQNSLLQGVSNSVILDLYNAGTIASGEFTAVLASLDEKCTIVDGECFFGNIESGESVMGSSCYTIEPEIDILDGEPAQFSLSIIADNNILWTTEFVLEVGNVTMESPTFSDYGYYAIESRDEGSFAAVTYDWLEINPQLGGAGSEIPVGHETSDGYSTCIQLPFEFCYYGNYYNEITVSTSGWLAMGDHEYVFFRNRIIPSGVGIDAMIAPFWDYLQDGELYAYYHEEEHSFYLEWYDFEDDYQHQEQTFQVILYDPEYYPTATGDGEIKFQYQTINNIDQIDNYATIGIESPCQSEGLLLSFANQYPLSVHSVSDETAILLTIKEGEVTPHIEASINEIEVTVIPDTIAEITVELINESIDEAVTYETTISHFPQRGANDGGVRDISENSINLITSTYFTTHELDIYAFMVHIPLDGEAVLGVELQCPDNVTVTGATDIAEMHYNGQTGAGALVSWGYGNGESYNGTLPQAFHIYLIVDEGTTAPITLEWRIDGDEEGSAPHSITGVATIMPSDDKYLWVEYPNGGENLVYGMDDTIQWSSYGDIDAVDIYYTENNFVNYEILGQNLPNTGEFVWTIPWELTGSGKIRVRETDGNIFDNSDTWFNITGLVITYPETGSLLEYGNQSQILWDYAGIAETVDLYYSANGGFSWELLAGNAPNTGCYEYTVNMAPTSHGKIRIEAEGEELIEYVLPGEFSVVDVPVTWLEIDAGAGIIEPTSSNTITLRFDTSGMSHGIYEAYITVRTEYNQRLFIPVQLEIPNLDTEENEIVSANHLAGNYPNPFFAADSRGSGTDIEFSISSESTVELAVYNLRGQKVCVLIDENLGAGNYSQHWNGRNKSDQPVAAGIYFYQLRIDDKPAAIKKCLLLK